MDVECFIKLFLDNPQICDCLIMLSVVCQMVWSLVEQSDNILIWATIQAFAWKHVWKSKPEGSVLVKILNEAAPSIRAI